jgi:hypothetical protein
LGFNINHKITIPVRNEVKWFEMEDVEKNIKIRGIALIIAGPFLL